MENHQEWAAEQAQLERILAIARAQLQAVIEKGEARRDALVSQRHELLEQSEQSFQNLWGAGDFEALVNLNQLAQPLAVAERTQALGIERFQMLSRMLDAPYFARVDIRFEEGDTEQVLIGRGTLRDECSHEIYVHDWRSPIASVFYRFGIGPAHYDAPAGRIDCEVLQKRQYEIQGGRLIYFFDADVQVQDEFLRGLLSKNSSPRMRSIVETIQRDQDAAIRDQSHELLMVQGVAGSGKTSIALHRVAFLMYEGLSARLAAENILILSPNELFERYIANVLPELGERSVQTTTPERLLERILDGGVQVRTRTERFEALCAAADGERAAMREAIAFKASGAFRTILDRFADELPRRWIAFADVAYAGETIATRQQLRQRILARKDRTVPLGIELQRMEMSLLAGVRQRRPARMARLLEFARKNPEHALELEAFPRACSMLESGILKRHIQRFTRLDCRALYRALVSDERAFRRLAAGLSLPDALADMLRATHAALSDAPLAFEDATAIAYLRLRLMGATGTARIRQLVVDEAQDYGPLLFSTLASLFPRARLTILGDIRQTLGSAADMSLYDEIRSAFGKRSAALVELNKSFRCTSEILRFSLRFLGDAGGIECFSRAGVPPRVVAAPDAEALAARAMDEARVCLESGCKSVALICKTVRSARHWQQRLGIPLMDGASEPDGVFAIPLALSKGLEFDAVLVLDADATHYAEPEDKNALYVACTRALHRLSLFYAGQPSPHLTDEEAHP